MCPYALSVFQTHFIRVLNDTIADSERVWTRPDQIFFVLSAAIVEVLPFHVPSTKMLPFLCTLGFD